MKVRLDQADASDSLAIDYERDILLDNRVIVIKYSTEIPQWIIDTAEHLGNMSDLDGISFWRLPNEQLAVKALLSVETVEKEQVI